MDVLNRHEFAELLRPQSKPCVSIYMPTHVGGLDIRQDTTRLKNHLAEATDQIKQDGNYQRDTHKLLTPIEDLLEDMKFWKDCSEGLALFLSPDMSRFYRLPVGFSESMTVGERYYIRPLLPVVETSVFAYLLALSQGNVQLYRVSRHDMDEVSVPDLPRNIEEALNYTSVDRGEQVHSSGQVTQGKQDGVFHGQGGKPDSKKQDLRSYCATIDRAVCRRLRPGEVPLALACVEYLEPIYREVSKYAQLAKGFVSGSPDHLSVDQLHNKSWQLLKPILEGPRSEALENLHDHKGSSDFTNDVYRILPAAHEGQIDLLFLDDSRKVWGKYQAQEQIVDVHDTLSPGDEDLLELAAVETLRHRGQVYAVSENELPTPAPLAAVLRYA